MEQNIGKELRLIRNYRGLTLRDLGMKTGISYSRLGKFEGGKEVPTIDIISKIEKVLDVNIEQYIETSKEIDIIFSDFLDSLFTMTIITIFLKIKLKKEK